MHYDNIYGAMTLSKITVSKMVRCVFIVRRHTLCSVMLNGILPNVALLNVIAPQYYWSVDSSLVANPIDTKTA